MSGIVHKIKEAVHSDSKSHNAPEGTHGPHSSRVANAADPRADSDRDHSSTLGTGRTAGHGEFGNTGYGTGATTGAGRTAGHGEFGSSGYGTGTSEGAHGPHGGRVENAMDPRVDSDFDNSRTMGAGRTAGTGAGAGFGSGTHHTPGGLGSGTTGMTGTHNTPGGFGSGTTGMTGTHHTPGGAGSGMTGMTGTHGAPEGSYGPHSSRMANAADPRVDSDRDGRGAIGTGPGPAPNTAGQHRSDIANKADPRIDSDLDGSRTMGGNKTYQSGAMSAHRDPTDASQVPPSVLKKHLGGPSIEHEDATHHRERRNSIKTHQESFSGI